MRIVIYIISALLTNYVFSLATSILVTAGFDKMGGDIGSPGIMLFSLLCINGILSIVTATIMGVAKAKYHKEFPAKLSALIFLFMYFPIHIIGLYFPDEQLSFLAAPLGNLFGAMQFFSYIPFFHMTAQGLINLYEFVKKKELAGNRYVKFYVLAGIAGIVLLTGWWMAHPFPSPAPNVLSMQDHWQLLESGGQDWQSDAYLNRAYFDVIGILPYKISATYLSKSKPDERYSIEIDENGKIYKKETSKTYPMRENAKLPIQREDWVIGSEQAWDLFQKNKEISACLSSDDKHVPISMHLGRILSGRLAWDLLVSSCHDDSHSASFYLDAKTGETIESYLK